MSMTVTIYHSPDGRVQLFELTEINEEDQAWFVQHNAKLSFEQLMTGDNVAYADIGLIDEEGEPIEAIEISFDRPCRETLAALRKQCEKMLEAK